ncbi:MAG: TonB-dependent receptor [bacterium]|nr:TonB-dependent receptor [bacterium]
MQSIQSNCLTNSNLVSRRNLPLFPFLGLMFLLLLQHSLAFGQPATASLVQGHVRDGTTNEPIPGASVSVVGTSDGVRTDIEGHFRFSSLATGMYRIQASSVGYKPLIKSDIVVAPGKQTEVVFLLTPTSVELSEVVVTPSYFEENPATPVSSQTLSNEEIRRAPGGNEDVVRAIAVLPGVAQTSAGRNDLIVRGGAPSENLYVVDGHEVPNINHFGTQGASGGPLSFVNLDFVRDVTFSTGGFGVKYGDRLSSVTDINMKEGRSDRIGGKATLAASQFGFNLEGPVNRNSSFLFSARRSYLDFVFKAAGFGFVPEYWDFLGKYIYRPNAKNEISVINIGALDKVRFFNDTDDQRYNNSQVLGSSQNQYFSGVLWQHVMKEGVWNNALTRTYVDYDFLQTDSLLQPIFTSQSKEGETGLRSDVLRRISPTTTISAGIQGKTVLTDGALVLRGLQTSFGDSLRLTQTDWRDRAFKSSAYFQLSHNMMKQMTASLGGRLDYFDQIRTKTAVSPRLSLTYSLSEQSSVTLSGGVYRQAPSYVWIASNPANRDLAFLRADQVVLGYEKRLRPDTRIRIEGYLKKYRDYPASLDRSYLVLANTGAGFGGSREGFSSFGLDRLSSVGTGISRGVELLIQKRLSEIRSYGIASFTFGRTDFTGIDGKKRPGSYDQRMIMNISGGYVPNAKWEFSGKFRYGTGAPYTPYDNVGKQSAASYNTKRIPDFHSIDLRVDRRWNRSGWTLVTYLDIQNAYNHQNVSSYNWNEREQKVEENTDIGILPSIGISAEF